MTGVHAAHPCRAAPVATGGHTQEARDVAGPIVHDISDEVAGMAAPLDCHAATIPHDGHGHVSHLWQPRGRSQ